MNGKKLLVLYSGLAVASAVSTAGLYGQLNKSREVPAFSYDVQFFRYDDGVKQYTHTSHIAVRGDGSQAVVDNAIMAAAGERRVTVRDFAKREAWITSLLGRTVTTLPIAPRAVPEVHTDQCDKGEVSTFGPYEVRKERHLGRNEEGAVLRILERWRAPELGCVTLRTIMYNQDEKITHEQVATNIVIGEPDQTLFQVPQGYVERSPSQAFQALIDIGATVPLQDDMGALERADRRYWNTR